MAADGLSKKVTYGALAGFYAALLTDKQQALLEMYCDEDLSLSEIARREKISRQAVSEHLNRAYLRLDALEAELGMFARFRELGDSVARCLHHLDMVEASEETKLHLVQAQAILRRHMDEEEA